MITIISPLPLIILDKNISQSQGIIAFGLPALVHIVVGNVVEPLLYEHFLTGDSRPAMLRKGGRFRGRPVVREKEAQRWACAPAVVEFPCSALLCSALLCSALLCSLLSTHRDHLHHRAHLFRTVRDNDGDYDDDGKEIMPASTTTIRKLTIHPVVVLLSLCIWYILWGVIGAVLAVPIVAIVQLVLEEIREFCEKERLAPDMYKDISLICDLLQGQIPGFTLGDADEGGTVTPENGGGVKES